MVGAEDGSAEERRRSHPAHPAGVSHSISGEHLPAIRAENLEQGVPVDRDLWEEIKGLAEEPLETSR